MISAKDAATLWKAGKLRYKLHSGQRELHDHYRAWADSSLKARQAGEMLSGKYPRIYVADCSRRFGKDFWGITERIEDAIQRPGSVLTYATAYAKDISSIVVPLFEQIIQDCPHTFKPVFKASYQGTEAGFYFPNKSVIKLVGIDRNPDGLRGRFSDGITISEAGFVDRLRDAIVSVLLPQLQGRLHATIVLNSTPPKIPGHAYDDLFCPDSIDRGAYFTRTIMDNPMLSDSERTEFVEAAGGLESEDCQREYFCKRIRSQTRVVVPEFDPERHVKAAPPPEYALGFTVIDPGITDICAVQVGYYDFERAKLVIRKDWGKTGANTNEVVRAIRAMEHDVFGQLWYWGGTKFTSNPFLRVSDTDARLIQDLNTIHDLRIGAAEKTGAEAALHSLRNAFQRDDLEIHPDAKMTISHLTNGVWNKTRTSYERSEQYGHFDQIDTCKYMWRHVNKVMNPHPPRGITLQKTTSLDNIFHRPDQLVTKRPMIEALNSMMPKRWKSGRRR